MTNNTRPLISVYVATSIDGYIAKANGNLDWLNEIPPPSGEDYGFYNFITSVDSVVMGRGTYEAASTVEAWPYMGKRVVVLSNSLQTVRKDVELYHGDISSLIERLHADGIKHIYADGGVTVSQFMNERMIDQLILTMMPVVLGAGIPLFRQVKLESWWKLASVKYYENGVVQLCYKK